jgi:hypothetical protein
MSLILEALRKLEREKPDQARHTTVLLAPLAWPQAARRRWLGVVLSAALLTGLLAAGWFFLRSAPPQPTPPLDRVAQRPPASPMPTATAMPMPSAPLAVAHPAQAGPPAKRTAKPAAQAREAAASGFRLTAIGDQEGVRVAVVNDRLVRVGDSLLGARVVRIDDAEVELVSEADGRRFTLGF